MKITKINNEKDLDNAYAHIGELLSIPEESITIQEENELNIISLLVEQYENIYHTIDVIDPIELLKTLMEERGWKAKDFAYLIGNKSLASLILNRKRALSLNIMKILNKEFLIPFEILILGSDIKKDIAA